MTKTVIQHVLSRLHDIGVDDVFGVPGDYSFPVNDAICNHRDVRWIGCSNELNAAYAADGYARIKGAAALCTTYGVGELSAVNGIAGCYAEHLPVFHLVGTPNMTAQMGRKLMHHTLGTGEYDLFRRMTEPVVIAHAVMTPENVAYETERLIFEALYHRRPVYMAFPADLAEMPVLGSAEPIPAPRSNRANLEAAAETIAALLEQAETACVLPGILVARAGLRPELQEFIDTSGLPFSTMFMSKSVLDEQHPCYIGMYDGALMNEDVRDFVEGCDQVVSIGAPMTDFNSGAFTSRLDHKRTIAIGQHHAHVGGRTYSGVEMGDLLSTLASRVPHRNWKKIRPSSLGPMMGSGADAIDAETLYPRWAAFIRPGDIVIAETGTASMGLGFALMPKDATFHNQTLWGSVGWATPAAFGAAVAAPERRIVLVTGDGAHQLTVQEISQFTRYGLKAVVFVLNNDGYLIERLLCKDPAIAYNDIAQWHYSNLPHAFGCDDWVARRVATCGELDDALEEATEARTGVYVEVVTDAYAASPLAVKLHDAMQALYKA
ncbi:MULTISPECIES: alpha-keto acid decarboxylase family protein [unclassified Sinorhizobium]|uniref:alpha-keto acid decarboxylase family protein n=1 Tax=unclassified Sinorhizobium TaxID=2613772 RepID=UPI0035255CD5